MEIYNIKVLLGGSRTNEVRKHAVPAAEIFMLRHIHGEDMVTEIEHVGSSNIKDSEVRELLALSYGPADVDTTRAGPAILKEVFGPVGVALPQRIEEVEHLKVENKVTAERVKKFRDIKADDQVFPPIGNTPASAPAFAD